MPSIIFDASLDPTAGHYLKLLRDAIFGPEQQVGTGLKPASLFRRHYATATRTPVYTCITRPMPNRGETPCVTQATVGLAGQRRHRRPEHYCDGGFRYLTRANSRWLTMSCFMGFDAYAI